MALDSPTVITIGNVYKNRSLGGRGRRNERTNERRNERTNEWMNEWMNEWTNEWMNGFDSSPFHYEFSLQLSTFLSIRNLTLTIISSSFTNNNNLPLSYWLGWFTGSVFLLVHFLAWRPLITARSYFGLCCKWAYQEDMPLPTTAAFVRGQHLIE